MPTQYITRRIVAHRRHSMSHVDHTVYSDNERVLHAWVHHTTHTGLIGHSFSDNQTHVVVIGADLVDGSDGNPTPAFCTSAVNGLSSGIVHHWGVDRVVKNHRF